MLAMNSFKKQVLELKKESFDKLALQIFKFQAENNFIYKNYLKFLSKDYTQISRISQIPFLPIEFFKHHRIVSSNWQSQKTFLSSGTTDNNRSSHEIQDIQFYHQLSSSIFEQNYSKISNTAILALLPSYLEQGQSSLVEMVSHFIKSSENEHSGFYLNNDDQLIEKIKILKSKYKNIVIFGVTYALLDLVEKQNLDFSNITLIETGGMKGRREELSKKEVHQILKAKLNLEIIHSEYGMTELLSQAYSKKDGIFEPPNSMKILIRDLNDPFSYLEHGKSGGVNIIDLANIHSCAFIETKDIGLKIDTNNFKILGRFDNSDLRGCNLLVN
jgi:hypothetical protein